MATTRNGAGWRTKYLYIVCSLLLWAGLPPSATAEQELPDVGHSDTSLVTRANEKAIAEQVLRNLRQSDLILDDPELSEYIQSLGNRLSSHAQTANGEFHFFILNDMEVNAFALPAGYIAVHAGLFLTSQSEDELAAVLAHEIAHITQRHYARNEELSKQQDVVMAAAILAAIAVGRQDNNASMAILYGSMANSITSSLSFSRSHEKEADWLGMQILKDSGYSPDGMAEFFQRLQDATRYSDANAPEYMRTHPVTSSRISDARQRAADLRGQGLGMVNQEAYGYMWRRLDHLVDTRSQFKAPPASAPGQVEYARALQLLADNRPREAIAPIEAARQKAPEQVSILMTAAAIYHQVGDHQALSIYQRLHDLYPGQSAITLNYARLLIDSGDPVAAQKLLRGWLQNRPQPIPEAYRLLSEAHSRLGNIALAHRAMADYYFETGRPYEALKQLEVALAQPGLSFYEQEELDAKLHAVKQHIELLAKVPNTP